MKKSLVFTYALMSLSVLSRAQNVVTVNQKGTSQSASATQTGSDLRATINQDQQSGTNAGNYATTGQTTDGEGVNTAVINQTNGSNSNRAGVTQLGARNQGTINQRNASGSNGTPIVVTATTSAATVRQAGGNWANIFQQGTANTQTEITQSNRSSGNVGDIRQYGDANRQTSINQSGESESNTARINQGTASAGVSDNRAVISQLASAGNTATITQRTNGNDASVNQTNGSSANAATISQTGGEGSYASVSQADAHSGQATINQQAGSNRAFITQEAYFNRAVINQAGAGSDGNTATITQKVGSVGGSSNQATINQLNGSTSNQATIAQASVGGTAVITQNNVAVNNQATISQSGYFGDWATIEQSNAREGKVTISQNGGSIAHVKQGIANGTTSVGNVVTIAQRDRANATRLQQLGDLNQARINQTGNYNAVRNGNGQVGSFALQQGTGNALTVAQNAYFVPNLANVSQSGNNNTATINQKGSY